MATTYTRLRKLGFSEAEARSRAKAIDAAQAGPCKCQDVKHLPGDERCPDSYSPPRVGWPYARATR